MTEERVGFLYKLSAQLSTTQTNSTLAFLRRFYLMRCHDITRSYGLPTQQFSPNLRCSHCCQEWKTGKFETKVIPTKASKKHTWKLENFEVTENKDSTKSKRDLPHCNMLERTCSFCQHTTTISLKKPANFVTTEKPVNKIGKANSIKTKVASQTVSIKVDSKCANIYRNTKDIFSLQNRDNILASSLRHTPKVIKNNKKKKDKFAGLCKEAVLASAKKSKELLSKNKLDLFLKPAL